MPQNKPLHAFRNSGQEARTWKRRVALLAKRGSESVRTLQFPLDISDEARTAIPLDKFKTAYNAIEGTEPGTLFDYWAKLHLAGFRFFTSSGLASIFRQQAIFNDDEWNTQFRAQSQHNWPWMAPSKLFERFGKAPREVKKRDGSIKSVDFTASNVANECHVTLVGTSLTDKTPTDQRAFFERIGQALAAEFETWSAANGDIQSVMSVLDKFFKAEGCKSLPSLSVMAQKYGPTKPEYATVAWCDVPATVKVHPAPPYSRGARAGTPRHLMPASASLCKNSPPPRMCPRWHGCSAADSRTLGKPRSSRLWRTSTSRRARKTLSSP